MKEKLLKIIEHYGASHQRKKLCEEFMELQDELFCACEQGGYRDNLLSEIADVLVLVMQFAYSYGYSDNDIKQMMEYKVDRQIKRMGEE